MVLGARDMHRNLKAPVEHEIQRADRLLHALRGDELFRAQAKYDQPNQNLPQRRTGSYLPDYDLKKIKAFLVGLIGGMGDDESHVEPDKKQAEPE